MSCGAIVWPYPWRARKTTSCPARWPNVRAPDGSPYGVRMTIRRGRSSAESFAKPLPPMIAYISPPEQAGQFVFVDDAHFQFTCTVEFAACVLARHDVVGLLRHRSAHLAARRFDLCAGLITR